MSIETGNYLVVKEKKIILSQYPVVFNDGAQLNNLSDWAITVMMKRKKKVRPLKESNTLIGGSRPEPRPGTVADGENQNVPDKFTLSLRCKKIGNGHYIINSFFSLREKNHNFGSHDSC